MDLTQLGTPLQRTSSGLRLVREAAPSEPVTEEYTPAPEKGGLAEAMADSLVSGLGMAGNLLDLPGSSVRDVIAGENPFDQWMDPFSHWEKGSSVTGREMLAARGLASENKETGVSGWADDPMEGVQDVAGFMAELATDPFGWATGYFKGAGAAARAANVAKETTKSTKLIGRTLDAAGQALNTLDPGYHVGRAIKATAGEAIDKQAAKLGSTVSAAAKTGISRLERYSGRHEFDMAKRSDLEMELSSLKSHGYAPSDAKIITKLSPLHMMARRVGAAFGSDVYFYGGSKKSPKALGAAFPFKDNRVWVNSDQPMMEMFDTIGHETMHKFRNANGELYQELIKNVMAHVDDPKQFVHTAMESYPGHEKLGEAVKVEEGITMLTGMAFQNPELYRRVMGDPRLKKPIQEALDYAHKQASKHLTSAEARDLGDALNKVFDPDAGFRKGATGEQMFDVDMGIGATLRNNADDVIGPGASAEALNKRYASQMTDRHLVNTFKATGDEVLEGFHESNRLERGREFVDSAGRKVVKSVFDLVDGLDRSVRAQFNWRYMGRITRVGQEFAYEVTKNIEDITPELSLSMMHITETLHSIDKLDDPVVLQGIRKAVEMDVYDHLPEGIQAATREMKRMFAQIHTEGRRAGMKKSLLDDVVDWFARGMTPEIKEALRVSGKLKEHHKGMAGLFEVQNAGKRTWQFREAIGGTDEFNALTGNEQALDFIRMGDDKMKHAVAVMRRAHGNTIDPRIPILHQKGDTTELLLRRADGSFEWKDQDDFFREFEIKRPVDKHTLQDEPNVRRAMYNSPLEADVQVPPPADILKHLTDEAERIIARGEEVHWMPELTDVADLKSVDVDDLEEMFKIATRREIVTHVTETSGRIKLDLLPDAIRNKFDKNHLKSKKYGLKSPRVIPDRFEVIADWIKDKRLADKLQQSGGLFRNNPLAEALNRMRGEVFKISVARELPGAFSNMIDRGLLVQSGIARGDTGSMKLFEVLQKHFPHMESRVIYDKMFMQNKHVRELAATYGNDPKQWRSALGQFLVDDKVLKDLTSAGDMMQLPDSLKGVTDLMRGSTAMFKAGVLTWASRYVRDFISGQTANYLNNVFSMEAGKRAYNVLKGNADEALVQMPQLREVAERMGLRKVAEARVDIQDVVGMAGSGGYGTRYTVESFEKINGLTVANVIDKNNKMTQIPADDLEVISKGRDWFTPQDAVTAARAEYASRKGGDFSIHRDPNLDTINDLAPEVYGSDEIRSALPGSSRKLESGKRTSIPRDAWDALRNGSINVFNVEGVPRYLDSKEGLKGTVRSRREQTFKEFGLLAAGNVIGKNADDMNRLVAWMEGMRQGRTSKEAFENATRIQLDYRPSTFGPIEKNILKKIFPFYSFFSRESAYLSKEILTNPAGRLGKLIRAQHHATLQGGNGEDRQYLPEHVREKTAIPLGETTDGTRSYLTGLGLMHEDPLSALAGGLADPQAGTRKALSMMNPLLKGFAEYGLGVSSFQGGPLGGRPLHEMDPLVGRIMAQLGIQDVPEGGRPAPFINSGTEFILTNSPLSRALSTVRTALDDRKTLLQRAAKLSSGVQITTVDEAASERGLNAVTDRIARDLGAPAFSRVNISKQMIEDAAGDPEKQQMLIEIMELRKERGRLKRERAKAAKSQTP